MSSGSGPAGIRGLLISLVLATLLVTAVVWALRASRTPPEEAGAPERGAEVAEPESPANGARRMGRADEADDEGDPGTEGDQGDSDRSAQGDGTPEAPTDTESSGAEQADQFAIDGDVRFTDPPSGTLGAALERRTLGRRSEAQIPQTVDRETALNAAQLYAGRPMEPVRARFAVDGPPVHVIAWDAPRALPPRSERTDDAPTPQLSATASADRIALLIAAGEFAEPAAGPAVDVPRFTMEMVERALSSQAGSGPGADVPGDRVPVYRLISEDVFDEAGPAAEYALRRNDRWYQLNVYADDGVVVDLELLDMGSNF